MSQQFDDLESQIRQRLETLREKVESTERPIISSIEFSKNDFFPVRASVSFIRDANGDEVALTVDVKERGGRFTIECEILKESQILAEMPSLNIEISTPTTKISSALDGWVASFEKFISEKFELLRSAVHAL